MLISVIVVSTQPVWKAMALLFLEAAVVIISASNYFCVMNFWLIVQMYRYHRFEFNVHYKQKVALVIISYASMIILLFCNLIAFTTCFCIS